MNRRMVRRAVAVAALSVLGVAGTAHAASYGFDFVLNGSLDQGGSTQVHVELFEPDTAVTVVLDCPSKNFTLATPTADAEGVVDLIITIPADAPDELCAIVVSGTAAAGGALNKSFNIAIGDAAQNSLPDTGSSTGSSVSLALGIIVLGTVIFAASRFRQRAATPIS